MREEKLQLTPTQLAHSTGISRTGGVEIRRQGIVTICTLCRLAQIRIHHSNRAAVELGMDGIHQAAIGTR